MHAQWYGYRASTAQLRSKLLGKFSEYFPFNAVSEIARMSKN
jgi:hypothetical protein